MHEKAIGFNSEIANSLLLYRYYGNILYAILVAIAAAYE